MGRYIQNITDKMERYIQNITDKIVQVTKEENRELLSVASNKLNSELGIFQMPELAFAYECGKQIMQNANEIFEENIPKWSRELDLGNGGPTDLVFIFDDGRKIAIEFKMRNTGDAYIEDLNKLSGISDSKVIKIFCAIVDIMEKDLPYDGRVSKIDNDIRTEKLYINSIKTNQSWYKTDVYALIGIWKVIEEKK